MLALLELAAEVADRFADVKRKAFVGAVAIRQDGVLVSSRNLSTIMPSMRVPSIHAERRVLKKAGIGAIVYVARVKRDGTLALARPCPTCRAMLRSRRIKLVYYTIGPDAWEGFIP
jgi:cytidine deaminase